MKPGAVSQLAGAYHGARPGIGLTFAELRAYEPGDDVRHIDWNVTARQGRPFVRRYVEERALTLWLVVDVSASMRFGLERATKADRAAQAAALLATAAVQNGDRVGLALVSDRIELELAPAGGVRHLSQLVRALVATPTTSPGTKLSIGLARVRRTARRAMLVVISDFVSEEPSLTWRRAARRHDTIAIRVVDPRETKLPDAGILSLEDVERGKKRFVDSSSRRLRTEYAKAAVDRAESFQRWCGNSGIEPFTMMTDSDPIIPLIELFSRRNTPGVACERADRAISRAAATQSGPGALVRNPRPGSRLAHRPGARRARRSVARLEDHSRSAPPFASRRCLARAARRIGAWPSGRALRPPQKPRSPHVLAPRGAPRQPRNWRLSPCSRSCSARICFVS